MQGTPQPGEKPEWHLPILKTLDPPASAPQGHHDPGMVLCLCPECPEPSLVLMRLGEDWTLPSCPSGHRTPAPVDEDI